MRLIKILKKYKFLSIIFMGVMCRFHILQYRHFNTLN